MADLCLVWFPVTHVDSVIPDGWANILDICYNMNWLQDQMLFHIIIITRVRLSENEKQILCKLQLCGWLIYV